MYGENRMEKKATQPAPARNGTPDDAAPQPAADAPSSAAVPLSRS